MAGYETIGNKRPELTGVMTGALSHEARSTTPNSTLAVQTLTGDIRVKDRGIDTHPDLLIFRTCREEFAVRTEANAANVQVALRWGVVIMQHTRKEH